MLTISIGCVDLVVHAGYVACTSGVTEAEPTASRFGVIANDCDYDSCVEHSCA